MQKNKYILAYNKLEQFPGKETVDKGTIYLWTDLIYLSSYNKLCKNRF